MTDTLPMPVEATPPVPVLLPVEEVEIVERPKIEAPGLLEFLSIRKGTDFEDIPAAVHPFYLLTRDGMFLRGSNVFGDYIIPQKTMPTHLGPMERGKAGIFWWKSEDLLPADFIAQVVHFFRVVWEKHRAEAEVLILWNPELKKYRPWIPVQRVNGGGVKSIYEAADIPEGYQLVGSLHSHCNFGAFHSGTDTDDASSFNGLHITIGKIEDDIPEFATMVAINGHFFNFNIKDVARLPEDYEVNPSPEQWLNFVVRTAEEVATYGKTLTEADRARFAGTGGHNHPKPAWQNGGWNQGGANNWNNRRWVHDLNIYIPIDWMQGTNIKDEFKEKAIEAAFAELADKAKKIGYGAEWVIAPLDLTEGGKSDGKSTNGPNNLLPPIATPAPGIIKAIAPVATARAGVSDLALGEMDLDETDEDFVERILRDNPHLLS